MNLTCLLDVFTDKLISKHFKSIYCIISKRCFQLFYNIMPIFYIPLSVFTYIVYVSSVTHYRIRSVFLKVSESECNKIDHKF
jgi:hypothetical protein